MSFNVRLYTFSKKENSTKTPLNVSYDTFTCVLKDKSSILHPEIQLNLGLTNDPSTYNYAYIGAYSRYYFIEEWTFENGLWTASLKVDVLATYKGEIQGSTLYVLRAAGEYDGRVVDNLYPIKTNCDYDYSSINNPWSVYNCVIGCVSKQANIGSLAYFAMTTTELSTVVTNLQDNIIDDVTNSTNGFDISDAAPALQLSLVNPLQYIKSCMLFPVALVDIPTLGSSVGNAFIYNWDTGLAARQLRSQPTVTKSYTFDIIKHPDTTSRGNYVNTSPYTKLTLTIPPFGVIDIDTTVTCDASTLYVDIIIDFITGKGSLIVTCNGVVLHHIESQLGIPVSLSQVTRDYIGAVNGAAGAVAGAMGGYASGGAAGAALGSVSGIGSAIQSLMSRANTIGGTGGFGSNQGVFSLDHQFFRPVADDPVHNGRPLCKMKRLGDLSGYMIVQDGDVATLWGTAQEEKEIRSYLEGGFYHE